VDDFQSSRDIEEKGFRHWERFELEDALKVFKQGLERYPEDRKLQAGLAFTHLDLGDIPQARRLFEGLLALDEKDDESWWGLGRIHLLLSNYGEARFCFDRALDAARADERVLMDVGREWYLLGFYEESALYYRRALKSDAASAEALLGLGACEYWMGDTVEAEAHLKQALELEPGYHDCRGFLANVYFALHRHDEALEQFEKIPLAAHNDLVSLKRMIKLLRQRGVGEARLASLKAELKRLNQEQGWDAMVSSIFRRGQGGRS
jgi:tetratricopeptide (TPR) repeat protein